MSRITKLEISNFKRVKAVSIEPDGRPVIQVRGRNGQGKSSCLDAIAAALGGEKLAPKEPVRRGTDGAVVRVELDDGTIVERRWTAAGGSSLKLTNKEGLIYKKPQGRLDDLIGRLSFDPLAFLRLAPKEQAETLRKLAGVDFSLLDSKRQEAYDARTVVHRQVAQLRARLAAAPAVEAPDALQSSADLLAEHQRRSEQLTANNLKRSDLQRAKDVFARRKGEMEAAAAAMTRARLALDAAVEAHQVAEQQLEDARAAGVALKASVEQLVDPDLEELPRKLRELEAVNDRVRVRQMRAGLAGELAAAEAEAKKLDDAIAGIDEQKAEALQGAKLPIEGLAFDEAGVRFGGCLLEQASQAEQIRVSVAMGAALNPKLRATLVRDGSLLDAGSLELLRAEAERADLQVWLETVSTEGDGFVIEEGEVVGAAAPAPEAVR